MEHIKIENVCKDFGKNRVLNDINIDIKQGEFFTLLGPSGCGKTTLLRTLAGFYSQEEGNVFFEGENMNQVPAHKRNIGMVFQNYAIFPHLTVFDNVAYGLKARKIKKTEIKKRVQEALDMVELAHLGDRQPAQLSGGQQQRVALARAIVIRPNLLLMDEPLSNLDAKLRVKMREDIRNLQKELNITTIYVTHDQEEALAVSDRIAVLSEGFVQQIGKSHEIYLSPANKFVSSFIGSTNFLECFIEDNNVLLNNMNLPLNISKTYKGKGIYSVRPEQINLSNVDRESISSKITGEIIQSTFLGESVVYEVKLESNQVIDVTEYAVGSRELRNSGDLVSVDLNPKEAVIFNEDGGGVLNERAYSNHQETQSV